MAIPNEQIKQLLEKYKQGTCTDEELALLESWYLRYEEKDRPEVAEAARRQQADDIWAALPVNQPQAKRRVLWPQLAAAAIILVVLSVGLYFYLQPAPQSITQSIDKRPVLPGGNKAILTLANGKKINLTDAGSGALVNQAGTEITKTKGGLVAYHATGEQSSETVYNTIETPRGGQYQVVLPDGSKVWLNSASSIRFPASFAGLKERRITITGEAYFEVVHNAAVPFVVSAGGQQIKDIGTQFNVMSYADEGTVATTLLEGAVQLTENSSKCILQKPGQQGRLNAGTAVLSIQMVDAQQVTAWKNGLFVFDNTDLRALMRQISRWYNVEITYEPGVADDVFFGKIERSASLAKVLKILELGGVHFKLEGHKLTVRKLPIIKNASKIRRTPDESINTGLPEIKKPKVLPALPVYTCSGD